MAKIEILKLASLIANSENYRFEPVADEIEAINKMIEDQGQSLLNLCEHILLNGLNPNDRVQVITSNHDKSKYIVLEGNRRVITLKLVNNPELIAGSKNASLKKKFKSLHDSNLTKLITEVECALYDDPKEADKWIGIKHGYGLSGVFTDRWESLQKQRFGEKTEGKTSNSIQIINLLKNASEVPIEIKNEIEGINTTNLDRLIDDPDVRSFLGIEISNGVIQSKVREIEVIKGLTQIVKDIMNPNFSVKKIYNKDDRKDYINNFAKEKTPDISLNADNVWTFNYTSTAVPQSNPIKPKPIQKSRNTLIPKSCVLNIKSPKVNSIYHELQKINLENFPQVVSISLRVLVENSIDYFIEHNKISTCKDGSILDREKKLKVKIIELANYLETNKLADKQICKGIRSAANNKDDLLGVDTLHAYIHNEKFSPIPAYLIVTWDNIQPFIESIWNNIE